MGFEIKHIQLIPVELAWQITKLGDSPNIWNSPYYRQWKLDIQGNSFSYQRNNRKSSNIAVCTFASVLDHGASEYSHFYIQFWSPNSIKWLPMNKKYLVFFTFVHNIELVYWSARQQKYLKVWNELKIRKQHLWDVAAQICWVSKGVYCHVCVS